MPDQEQLLAEIASLRQLLAAQVHQIEQLRQANAELAAANEQLQGSEEKYKTLVETLPDAVIMADLTGHATFVSRRLLELHRAASVEEFMGKTAWDYLVPEDHEKGNAYYQNTLKEGITRNAELSFFRMDGTRFPTELSSALVKDASGKPVAIINVLRDISERKRAEQALRQSEERFRSYFEQGLLGMAISDKDMRWTEVNDRFCDILRCAKEDILRRRISEFIHPDDLPSFHQSYERILSGEIDHFTADRKYVLKDGRIIYVNVFVRVFRLADGAVDHVLALVDDVTGRRQVEKALQASEERYRAVVEDQTETICRFTADGAFTFVNDVFCRFFGKKSQELVGEKWHPVAVAEDVPMIEKRLSTMSPHNPIVIIENRVCSGLGKVHWMQFVNRGFYDDTGQLIEIQSVGRDITRRKEVEEALKQEHRTLRHLLQSSDHERRTIAYDIHDGLAQQLAGAIMQFDVSESLLEKRPEDAAKAYDAAKTLLRQGHGEARRLIAGIRHPVLDEAGVVEAVAHLINEQNRAKGPQIAFHSIVNFSRLVPLLENAIYRIIQEGMTNACRYSRSNRVRITLLQQKERLRIEIRDWGIGFDPKETKEGSYGLAGIRERTRLLGGKFGLKTAGGKGTRLVVELPLLERD
jgi:PAS domain S-box-containing protein